ncbi:hypothetical protein, partial [Bacillus sp. mrc49]
MSSEKTGNLGLHKWAPTDGVLRTEFNDNFGKLDEKVAGIGDVSLIPQPTVVDALKDKDDKIDDRGISIKKFIVASETSHDQAFQRANDYIRNLAISTGFTNVPSLRVPTGKYIINKEVKMSPYVKIKSEGYVGFSVTFNGTGFYVAPNSDDPKYSNSAGTPLELSKLSWNRGKYFDGSNGAIIFSTTVDKSMVGAKTVA